jgi:AraC-like DNA-binding protein
MYIDRNFAADIDLDNIASEAYFSKFHFIRQFKIIYGQTPHQYLIAVRIRKAKEFLQTDISIIETCYLVGFDSASSFTGLFKKYTNLTPSAYQRQQLQRKEEIRISPLKFIPNCFAEQKGWKEQFSTTASNDPC